MNKQSTNNELKDFIGETLRQVQEGVGEHFVHDQIHFKIAIAKTNIKGGKLGVAVLGLGEIGGKGEVKIEHASEIGFSVDLKREPINLPSVQNEGADWSLQS